MSTKSLLTTVPRNTLAHVHHKEIDAILKDLKFSSRRLKAALDGFKDELRILNRLYYKCKNQHRMALFFKRVLEIRRYGRRISESDILERVNLLRASFVGLEHTHDHKALKGSWTHVPEKPYVYFLTERLTACSGLVTKMRERLEGAYHHFSLAMQTGAFVQIIILFVAISSRMSMLSSELEDALQLGTSACNRLSFIIHPTSERTATVQQSLSEPKSCGLHDDVPSEDTGQSISRYPPIDSEDPVMEVEATLEMAATRPPSRRPEICVKNDTGSDHTQAPKATQKLRVMKAKKKFDEIDEIFGF